MIRRFACRRTEALFQQGKCPAQWQALQKVAVRKLDMIDAASVISDLRSPPGNRLEKLHGNRENQWSIRINDQWRICFSWTSDGPTDVEIVDYH